uniref:Uncharacterized protein n=1 Tax=viral metagenome TaxID=1070528 RepID=A0A6C0AP36_9ZZZZ
MKPTKIKIAKAVVLIAGISLIAVGAALGMGPMIIGGLVLFIGAGIVHIFTSIHRSA